MDFRLLDLIATVIDFCTPLKERGRGHPQSATVRVLATLRQFLREGTLWRGYRIAGLDRDTVAVRELMLLLKSYP